VTDRVLVTGATGFIGRHALAPLQALGFEVHAAARRPGTDAGVTWHEADLLAPGAAERLVGACEPTHLLHLAWYAEPGRFWSAPVNLAWTEASLALYRAFAERGGRRAVLAGTCAEYDWSAGLCVEDETPLRPTSLYGACKQAVGSAVDAYGALHGPSTAWGRVFFLYGPGEHPARLVASVAGALRAGERVAVTHGRQVRDFLHVADVAGAFAALVRREDVRGAVNVASGDAVSLRDVLGELAAALGGADLIDFGARAADPSEPPTILADVRRLREEAGFTPHFTLATGIADTVNGT
jgi:nucleoside-diphosphate-sugar epimerase